MCRVVRYNSESLDRSTRRTHKLPETAEVNNIIMHGGGKRHMLLVSEEIKKQQGLAILIPMIRVRELITIK